MRAGASTRYGVDGALIGRASYGNPYVFRHEDIPAQHGARSSVAARRHRRMTSITFFTLP